MDEYDLVKKSSLKFKCDKKKHKKSKKRKLESQEINDSLSDAVHRELQLDAADHGDWWKATRYEDVRGDVALEFLPGCYAKSLDNGRIVLGKPHPKGEGPDEEEIFTIVGATVKIVPSPDGCQNLRINQISFKTGFDRYWTIDSKERLMGLSEAIGPLESFEPVFEDNKTAICAQNNCFLSVEDGDIQQIVARSSKASSGEFLTIRVPNNPEK